MDGKNKNSPKGVSLPLVTGLVTLLMIASMAANEMIIRTIHSVRGVESSNRAYFAAEAGIEDGLYELTPHLAGYQTPGLGTEDVRQNVFDAQGRWKNEWAVESRSGTTTWQGKIFKGEKLVISLYADNNSVVENSNAINNSGVPPNNILNLEPSNFSIKFSVPTSGSTFEILRIDNDQDGKVNEDGPNESSDSCGGVANPNPQDADCDGRVDEDSERDPVILWKLSDNKGKSLIPLPGCFRDTNSKDPGTEKSEMCERDFKKIDAFFTTTLDSGAFGLNELGANQTIQDFIDNSENTDQLQFEFLIIAPMEFADGNFFPAKLIPIPYIQYEVNSNSSQIPYPYFTLKSDGYYGTYKQSITTTVTPKTTVPLFDFTIIQQK